MVWPGLKEFRNELLADLNQRGNIYFMKRCSRNIYVRCRRCRSFQLRFTYSMKGNREVNIVFNKGTTYHTGAKH